jgi:hypothetical protein
VDEKSKRKPRVSDHLTTRHEDFKISKLYWLPHKNSYFPILGIKNYNRYIKKHIQNATNKQTTTKTITTTTTITKYTC